MKYSDQKTLKQSTQLRSLLITIALLCFLFAYGVSYAQISNNTITGNISLDQGTTQQDLELMVEFRRHSIAVLPFPFQIIHPVIGTDAANVTLPAGSSNTSYTINSIFDPIFFSILVRCINCDGVSPLSYYTPRGTVTSFSNNVVFNGDEIPSVANFTLQTFSEVSGVIALENGALAREDLRFSVTAFDTNNLFLVGVGGFTIREGTNLTEYNLDRIPSAIASNEFFIEVTCQNCSNQPETFRFTDALSSLTNHTEINFEIPTLRTNILPQILYLLSPEDG